MWQLICKIVNWFKGTPAPYHMSESQIISYLESRKRALAQGPEAYKIWQQLEYLDDDELEEVEEFERRMYGVED